MIMSEVWVDAPDPADSGYQETRCCDWCTRVFTGEDDPDRCEVWADEGADWAELQMELCIDCYERWQYNEAMDATYRSLPW